MTLISRIYSGVAPTYDDFTAATGYTQVPVQLVEAFQKVAERLAPGQTILDFGCGTGQLTSAFLQAEPQLHITGMEPCSPMAEKYAQKFGHRKLIMNGYDEYEGLPCADATYDIVAATGVFDHIKMTPRLVEEFMRAVKPGGYFAFTYHRLLKGQEGVDGKTISVNGIIIDANYSHADVYVHGLMQQTGATVEYQQPIRYGHNTYSIEYEGRTVYMHPETDKHTLVIARKPLIS